MIHADNFRANRARIIEALEGGLLVMTAYTKQQRSADMSFAFEQEANFWWLTGIEVADWWVIIDASQQKTWLVGSKVDEIHHIFDGSVSPEEALLTSGADKVITNDEGMSLLRLLAKKHTVVRTLGDEPHVEYFDFSLNPAQKKLRDMLDRTFNSVQDARKELAKLRGIKQPHELKAMRSAIDLTVKAFGHVKPLLPSLKYEYEVEAEFEYFIRRHGATGQAYDPVVASGHHSCTMHHVPGNVRLQKKKVLLLDIGAKVDGYSADISRTYAIGEPTKRQIEVHAAVRDATKRCIDLLGPNVSVETYHQDVDKIMQEHLVELGLMKVGDSKAYRKYFPHAISHGLGIDPHDPLGAPRHFQPGMVLTVEPGIYIPEEGIGVRIEDDILITATGHDNLSGRLSTDL